jgi:hypothetical protein
MRVHKTAFQPRLIQEIGEMLYLFRRRSGQRDGALWTP